MAETQDGPVKKCFNAQETVFTNVPIIIFKKKKEHIRINFLIF